MTSRRLCLPAEEPTTVEPTEEPTEEPMRNHRGAYRRTDRGAYRGRNHWELSTAA